jgi:hypothetical protein
MLKLNLLPPNIYEPRKKRAWFGVFVVVWIALAAGLIAWQLSLVNQKSQKQQELQQQQAIVEQVDRTEQEARNTRQLVAPLLARVSLADEVFRYNKQYPKLYRDVRRWTIDSVRYGSLGVAQGTTLQAQAVTRNLDEMARYLQVMLQCPLFTGVSISWSAAGATPSPGGMGGPYGGVPFGAPGVGAPAMPGGLSSAGQAQQQMDGVVFTVVATLREPLISQIQQWMAALGGAGATGFGVGAGMRGGLPGAPMMGGPMMGGPMMGGPGMTGTGPVMGPPVGVGGVPSGTAPGGAAGGSRGGFSPVE